jgi:hypothetical protein
MSEREKGRNGVDELLKQALRDDLPEDVERRLGVQIERFVAERRARGRAARPGALWQRLRRFAEGPALLPSRRLALALSSVLLVVAGFVLQSARGDDVFASSLTRASIANLLSREIRHAADVDLTVSVLGQGDRTRTWRIRWIGPTRSRADCGNGVDGPLSLEISVDGAALVEAERPPSQPAARPEELFRATLGPALPLISASVLADRIYRDWVLVESGVLHEEGRVRCLFRDGAQGAEYEVVVEARTFRPRIVRRFRLGRAGMPQSRVLEVDAELTWARGSNEGFADAVVPGSR